MLQFKEFLAVLPLMAIVGFVLFYAFSSPITFSKTLAKIKPYFQLSIIFVLMLFSCFIFLGIYIVFINAFSPSLSNHGIIHQIAILLLAMVILLLIEVKMDIFFINYLIEKKLLTNSESKMLSIFLKMIITVAFMFILGIKDSAYSLAQAYDINTETLFVYDMYIMFFTSSVVGFDYVLDMSQSNNNSIDLTK